MTYNTTYIDSLKGNASRNGTLAYNRKGNTTITADGYGNLILPYGTVNNILRVKVERTYEDYVDFIQTPAIEYAETSYYYYSEENRHFIALTNQLTVSGFVAQSILQYQNEATLVTLGMDDIIPNQEMSFYPNPAVNQFSIKNIAKNTTVEIIDLNGRVVKTVLASPNNPIDISNLTKGYYMVNVSNNTETFVEKLIVQ